MMTLTLNNIPFKSNKAPKMPKGAKLIMELKIPLTESL